MAAISFSLDRDVEARVSRYADGIGVSLEELAERALIFALTTVYPDNELPDGPFDGTIDNELPEGEIPTDPDFRLKRINNARVRQGYEPLASLDEAKTTMKSDETVSTKT